MAVTSVVDDGVDALPSSLTDEPLVLVAGALAVLALVVLAVLVYRWLSRTPGERFARTLGSLDAVAVLMHPNPDPDAMACALAAGEIAATRDTDATLYHPGEIRHDENRAFETILDVTFEQIGDANDIAEDAVVLVDHNEPRGIQGAKRIDPVAVVDHHPGDGTGERFTDTRTDVGACASIFGEYFRELGRTPTEEWVDPDPDNGDELTALEDARDEGVLPASLSTGLIYGIQSDTNNLISGCDAVDFGAVQYLYPGIDEERLGRIANPPVDAETLEIRARAITEREVRSPFAVSDVGTVSNSDAIPQAADELNRLEGIGAVVVLGDADGTIRLAGRSTDDRINMGKALREAVEDIPMAGAGGHARMGGGEVKVEHMEGLGPGEGLTREELKELLFDAMRGES
jgi:nanoRNase/pAp phosphatase (c-di-AMP/oligoRNAs hydrolase)